LFTPGKSNRFRVVRRATDKMNLRYTIYDLREALSAGAQICNLLAPWSRQSSLCHRKHLALTPRGKYRGFAIRWPRAIRASSNFSQLCRMQFGDTAECNAALPLSDLRFAICASRSNFIAARKSYVVNRKFSAARRVAATPSSQKVLATPRRQFKRMCQWACDSPRVTRASRALSAAWRRSHTFPVEA